MTFSCKVLDIMKVVA